MRMAMSKVPEFISKWINRRAAQSASWRFDGVTWVLPRTNLEQLQLANQIIFDATDGLDGEWSFADVGAALLTKGWLPKLIGVILVPKGSEFDPLLVRDRQELMRRFPADDAMQVMSFFLAANQNWIGSALMTAALKRPTSQGRKVASR